jgi:hypothetical protein
MHHAQEWENIWMVYSLFGLLIIPWTLGVGTVEHIGHAYRLAGSAVVLEVLGLGVMVRPAVGLLVPARGAVGACPGAGIPSLHDPYFPRRPHRAPVPPATRMCVLARPPVQWGMGSVLFGLALERVGQALTFGIVLALAATLGSIIPLLAFHSGEAGKAEGIFNWVALVRPWLACYLPTGVAGEAWAGMLFVLSHRWFVGVRTAECPLVCALSWASLRGWSCR